MITLRETQQRINSDPKHWSVYLMDFVDNFRYYRNPAVIAESIELSGDRMDALLASTAEYLCRELNLEGHPGLPTFRPVRYPGLYRAWKI